MKKSSKHNKLNKNHEKNMKMVTNELNYWTKRWKSLRIGKNLIKLGKKWSKSNWFKNRNKW